MIREPHEKHVLAVEPGENGVRRETILCNATREKRAQSYSKLGTGLPTVALLPASWLDIDLTMGLDEHDGYY